MTVAIAESKTALGHAVAKSALEILSTYYPGYGWMARCDGGVLYITVDKIGKVGMCRHLAMMHHDAKVFKDDIVKSAGELLERANLKRGRSTGEFAKTLDGAKKFKWRPMYYA
jgi:hypothetical protein